MTNSLNPHIGSALDDLLEQDGVLPEVRSVAVKRVLAWQICRTMEDERLGKTEMARRMNTSRASLDRLLDPDNPSVTLLTLDRAAAALGKNLRIEFVDQAG